MDFQAYNKILICADEIENLTVADTVIGYEFKIKYPSYRGAFLSCIEALSFKVDGEAIPEEEISFHLNGKDFLISELPECFKEYWYVRDKALIHVRKPGGLSRGAHTLEVHMVHRVPYTGYFGQYLTLDSDVTEIKECLG